MSGLYHRFVKGMLVLGLLALCVPAMAQSRPPRPTSRPAVASQAKAPLASKVGIEVMVVHATQGQPMVDSRLKSIMQHLRFLQFKRFSLLDKHRATLAMNSESTFSIRGGRRLKVQLLSRDARQARIRVRMFNDKGKLLDTTVSIHRNRSFILAGPKHDGGVLILPVTARY